MFDCEVEIVGGVAYYKPYCKKENDPFRDLYDEVMKDDNY